MGLHNSGCRRHDGGAKLGASFQELLPAAFEHLGRVWLRNIASLTDRVRSETTVRNLLKTWEDWGIFPSLFTKGLEALLLAPISDISHKDAVNEPDVWLRQKFMPWFSGLNQAQLPYACRMRGLAGSGLKTAACRVRLCHFERYWHLKVGMSVRLFGLQAAKELNGCVGVLEQWDSSVGRWSVRLKGGNAKAVKAENLLLENDVDNGHTLATASI